MYKLTLWLKMWHEVRREESSVFTHIENAVQSFLFFMPYFMQQNLFRAYGLPGNLNILLLKLKLD